MELFALVGLSAYCLVSLVVGTRLLLLARRTGEVPELLIGLAFLSGGGVGYTILVASTQCRETSPELARTLYYIGMPLISLCSALLYRFWHDLYHPRDRRAALVCWVAAGALVVGLAAQWATTDVGSVPSESFWYRLQLYVQGSAYAINTWANARFYRSLRRRIPLGLAEPIVANRVLLWGVASFAIVVQYAYSLALVHTAPAGQHAVANPGIISALGLVAGILIVLAFFPPRAYRRWVSSRPETGLG